QHAQHGQDGERREEQGAPPGTGAQPERIAGGRRSGAGGGARSGRDDGALRGDHGTSFPIACTSVQVSGRGGDLRGERAGGGRAGAAGGAPGQLPFAAEEGPGSSWAWCTPGRCTEPSSCSRSCTKASASS